MKKIALVAAVLAGILFLKKGDSTSHSSAIGKPAFALVEDSIQVPVTPDGSQKYWALRKLPSDYASSGTKLYPVMIFLHGAGQGRSPLKNLYSTPDGGVPYELEQGFWDGTAVNPADGLTYSFICISPQNNSNWSTSDVQLASILPYLLANYRIDPSRIYLTGLSAGGEGLCEYAYHLSLVPTIKFAAMIPMSEAGDNPAGHPWGANIAHDTVPAWGFGDPINDIHGEFTQDLLTAVNAVTPGLTRFTTYTGGHCCWEQFYRPTHRETFTWKGVTSSMNIYEWSLLNQRNTAPATTPTANAGSPQTITAPVNNVTLTGSGTPGSGHTISTYGWTKLSGAACTITTPGPSAGAATTTVTGLTTPGTYVFQLTVTNNIGATATSTVTITVNSLSATANAGPDQSISLPQDAALMLGTASTGTITSWKWTQLSGPAAASLAGVNNDSLYAGDLIAGTYVFQLAINGGSSTDQMTLTVGQRAPAPATGLHTVYHATPNADTGWTSSQIPGLLPGDTVKFSNAFRWVYISAQGLRGNPSNKIVLINEGGQTLVENLGGDTTNGHNGTIEISNCWYVEVSGKGAPGVQYGFNIQGDPNLIYDLGAGMQVLDNSRVVDVHDIWVHNIGTGFWSKNNGDCDVTQNLPNFTMDSISIHDSKFTDIWNEGMYIGNTSPDNGQFSYDPRPLVCGGVTIYPIPPHNGHYHVYNNIVDGTGRGGIQMASTSGGISEINNNIVRHNGRNGDDAQGTAISTGAYTCAYIHDNQMICTYTWGGASLGASKTGVPQRWENNRFDSCGYQRNFDLSITSRAWIDPPHEPSFANALAWVQFLFIDSKPTAFQDSSLTWIKNNTMLLCKNPAQGIVIQNDYGTLQFKAGNVIACNVTADGHTAPNVFIDPTATGFVFSTTCIANPVAGAGSDQSTTATLVHLLGTASVTSPATISLIRWTQVSGPNTAIMSAQTNLTNDISALVPGVYVFQLQITDSNGNSGFDTVQITITAVIPPPPSGCNCLQSLKPVNIH